MKNTIIIGALASVLVACTSSTEKKPFEGTIHYTNNFTSYTKQPNEDLVRIYGDTVIISFKNGNYHQTYNSKSPEGLRELIYNKSFNEVYMRIGDNDSFLVQTAGNTNGRKLFNEFIKETDFKILNYDLQEVTFESAYETPQRIFNITSQFYFNPDLHLNPKDWEQHKGSFFDKYAVLSESLYLKYVYIDHEAFKHEQTAFKVEKKTIDDELFERPGKVR